MYSVKKIWHLSLNASVNKWWKFTKLYITQAIIALNHYGNKLNSLTLLWIFIVFVTKEYSIYISLVKTPQCNKTMSQYAFILQDQSHL